MPKIPAHHVSANPLLPNPNGVSTCCIWHRRRGGSILYERVASTADQTNTSIEANQQRVMRAMRAKKAPIGRQSGPRGQADNTKLSAM